MRLSELVSFLPEPTFSSSADPEVSAVVCDSREARPGVLFVALPGTTRDGHDYILQAVAAGACAVVGERTDLNLPVPYVRVPDAREALADLAAGWNGHPARKLVMIGVTGTDGKTTTLTLLYHILCQAKLAVGMISTVNAVIGGELLDTGFHVTTPEAPALQSYLARMVKAGLTHALLEVTSHGLAQRRVAACDFDVAVITNITHEHLDYHGSFESYREAKGRLFAGLGAPAAKPGAPPRCAVLNRDDPSFEYLRQVSTAPVLSYGLGAGSDVSAEDIHADETGTRFVASLSGPRVAVSTPLVGEYYVANILAALAASVGALGIDPAVAAVGVAALTSVPGRWEKIEVGQPFAAIVDFAHTPNALRQVLETARQVTCGRVIAVFGSAGLRDRAKRRLMAAVATELADLAVFTAEDPRTESLEEILAEMARGAAAQGGIEGRSFVCIPDRGEALREAVGRAQPGDLVIACGKGHEQSMCFGETEYAWDDRVAMRAALAERLAIPGPAMPLLPTSGRGLS